MDKDLLKLFILTAIFIALEFAISGCTITPVNQMPPGAAPADGAAPAVKADWDARPEASNWTAHTVVALRELGPTLLASYVPGVCGDRIQFYTMLISSMARRESGFNPKEVYHESFGVDSIGLLQMSVSDNRTGGCDFKTASDVMDPEKNIRCAVAVLNKWVEHDGVLSEGDSSANAKGAARYWSVMREGPKHYKDEIINKARGTCK
jgi:hypothetical protein